MNSPINFIRDFFGGLAYHLPTLLICLVAVVIVLAKRYYEFGLKEEEFIQHIGIFGLSGSGKTNLAYLILQELARTGKQVAILC